MVFLVFGDRAMQVLYAYSLEPIAEVKADRKSFAFRKGRSPEQVHAFIMNCLSEPNAPEWILVTDIKTYYDTISHRLAYREYTNEKEYFKRIFKMWFYIEWRIIYKRRRYFASVVI